MNCAAVVMYMYSIYLSSCEIEASLSHTHNETTEVYLNA